MSFGRTPEEQLAERNRGKRRRSDSRDRRDRNCGGGGKNGWGGDPHHRRGGDSASGAGVAEGTAEGATLVQQPGQLAAALAEATEGGENGARARSAWDGSPTSSHSSSFSSTEDHSEVAVVAGKKMPRAMAEEPSGPEAFTLLLRLLMTHFDGVDTEDGYTKLHTFGMCNEMPLSDFSREVRVLVPTATGSERVLSPGTESGCGVGAGSGRGEKAISWSPSCVVPWFEGNGPAAIRLVGCYVAGF